jgi:hypothetical protein
MDRNGQGGSDGFGLDGISSGSSSDDWPSGHDEDSSDYSCGGHDENSDDETEGDAGEDGHLSALCGALGLPLGVPERGELRAAYIAIARDCHPDKTIARNPEERQNLSEVFSLAADAYKVLSRMDRNGQGGSDGFGLDGISSGSSSDDWRGGHDESSNDETEGDAGDKAEGASSKKKPRLH